MEMNLQNRKTMALTKLANDLSVLVSRLGQNAGFIQRVQMAKICALSTRSPNLLEQLRETRNHLQSWLNSNTGSWTKIETERVNRASLLRLFDEAIELMPIREIIQLNDAIQIKISSINDVISRITIELRGTFRKEERVHIFWRDLPTVDVSELVESTKVGLNDLNYLNCILYLTKWERLSHGCDVK